jgi:hypothetical protein
VTSSSSSSEAPPLRGQAFGLAICAEFPIPGVERPDGADALPSAALRLSDESAIARRWRAGEASSLSVETDGAGHVDRTIDVHPEDGYRIHARAYGLCVIARDGSTLLCAPPSVESWRWHRLLVGRCLPIAALLRGYEVLHAAGVAIDGGVVVIAGPTGAGKTSLAVHLTGLGGTLCSDDVLALQVTGDGLLAHAGPGVVNLRVSEDERLDGPEREALGALLGRTGAEKLHYAMPVATAPLPPRAMYFLGGGGGAPRSAIRPMARPDPLRLLTSTFVHQIRRPEHLARLLDVCSRLSADVPMYEVSIGSREDAAQLATSLWAHLDARVAS